MGERSGEEDAVTLVLVVVAAAQLAYRWTEMACVYMCECLCVCAHMIIIQ